MTPKTNANRATLKTNLLARLAVSKKPCTRGRIRAHVLQMKPFARVSQWVIGAQAAPSSARIARELGVPINCWIDDATQTLRRPNCATGRRQTFLGTDFMPQETCARSRGAACRTLPPLRRHLQSLKRSFSDASHASMSFGTLRCCPVPHTCGRNRAFDDLPNVRRCFTPTRVTQRPFRTAVDVSPAL